MFHFSSRDVIFIVPECFNPELWDKNSGKPFDENAKEELFSYLKDEHCDGLRW